MSAPKKILVVDDDQLVRELLRGVLASAGYDVLFAEDGLRALEMTSAEKPDLVLTDGLLPKLHGFEVCKAIKRFENPPKVVLLTGIYTKPTYRYQLSKDYGADAVLSKLSEMPELLARIKMELDSGDQQAALRSEPNVA